MDTRWAYTALVALVVVERLAELAIARRNARRLEARGGREAAAGHYPWMTRLHTAVLIACPLEVWLFGRPWIPALGIAMLLLLVGTMALRYWVIATLGDRWTTRIFVVPGEPPRFGGPYRWLRHPNYLAVILELIALPLIHTAWWTAALGSLANAWLLTVRIRQEEAALMSAHAAYHELDDRPRLIPGLGRSGHG